MRISILLTVLLCITTIASAGETLVFAAVNVVDTDGSPVLENQNVIISDGRIVSVSSDKLGKIPAGARVIDASNRYLMPGLAEMHAHIPPSRNRESMEEVLLLYLSQGITTIRGMLGEPGHLALRAAQTRGDIDAPRIYTSGPSLNGRSVSSAAQAVQMVEQQHAAGYDHLKLHPGLSLDEFNAVAKRAGELQMPFVGHVSTDVGAWRAIAAGQTGIDHMDGFIAALVPKDSVAAGRAEQFFGHNIAQYADSRHITKLATAVAEAGVWVVPTESLIVRRLNPEPAEALLAEPGMRYVSGHTRRQWQGAKNKLFDSPDYDAARIDHFLKLRAKLILALHRAGAGLLLGSDAPQVFNVPGFSIHDELALYVQSGLSAAEALATGTINVARYLGVAERRGQVKPGFDADLVLLEENPLSDISHTRTVSGVMIAGRWHDREWIDARLSTIARKYAD